MNRTEMIERIDIVADAQRNRIAVDPVKLFEYQAAYQAAIDFRASNYLGEVPLEISCWAQAKNWTPIQAADDIIQEAEIYHYAVRMIRAIRLTGKYAVKDATDDDIAFQIYETTISQLKSIGA